VIKLQPNLLEHHPQQPRFFPSNSSGTTFPSEKKNSRCFTSGPNSRTKCGLPSTLGVQNARISYQRTHKVLALGWQPSHKLLLNFMKLYLHESFVSMKLLTQKKI
jgi:hypothetical protein